MEDLECMCMLLLISKGYEQVKELLSSAAQPITEYLFRTAIHTRYTLSLQGNTPRAELVPHSLGKQSRHRDCKEMDVQVTSRCGEAGGRQGTVSALLAEHTGGINAV